MELPRTVFQDLKFKPGIDAEIREPMASLELVTVIVLQTETNPAGKNSIFAASRPLASKSATESNLTPADGYPRPKGNRRRKDCGRALSAAQIGSKLKFGKGDWEIVGVMSQGRRPSTVSYGST